MWGSLELLLVWFLVLAVGGTEHVYRPGRRVCAIRVPRGPVSESFVQRVYQPFLTTCDGHRACSTYRTIYRTAYRRSPGPAPARPRYACCPGWKRTSGLPGACGAVCQPPCQNGGSCVQPGRCHCPAGWRGDTCQTDVDECSAGGGGCPQHCVNTAGSYWCQCWEGHSPSADGVICLPKRGTPRVPHPIATTEAAAGAGPSAQPGLAGPGARAPGPRQPPGPLLPEAGPHRLPERADLLPGGAAGVVFLQEGAVTGQAQAPRVRGFCLLTPPSPLCWAGQEGAPHHSVTKRPTGQGAGGSSSV
ncbi:PREDICTED: epidermal growth factor-like protein 7 isoform X2 [Ceratotherium simum simum]|uniref:Epidermal growth factor-like protein 7 isoform X2 n=1 Tax=Ceratotherium simum simum TaxID=73337 RepID=A0ABM1CE17_CERSS|nr:PREDICTED: epidermal growth factor-like protein 7 isoform X2 [Ceratotherium simum simum]